METEYTILVEHYEISATRRLATYRFPRGVLETISADEGVAVPDLVLDQIQEGIKKLSGLLEEYHHTTESVSIVSVERLVSEDMLNGPLEVKGQRPFKVTH